MNRRPRSKLTSIGWILLGALGLGGILYIVLLIAVTGLRPTIPDNYTFSTAEITMIPAPTFTPVVIFPTSSQPTVTTTSGPPIDTGGITVGLYVKISGTNGEGLNMRASPGTKSAINFLGMDSEVFLVKDGPQQVDNIVWWYLQAPYDATRSGWAAADYLTLIQNP